MGSDKRSDLFLKFLVFLTIGVVIYGGIKSLVEKYDTIEPFAIEHYTFTEDGMFNIYFNRDILKDEEIELKVWLDNNHSKGKYGTIPINEDTDRQIFTYDSNRKNVLNEPFNLLIKNHVQNVDTITTICFDFAAKYGNSCGREGTFIDGKLWFVLWAKFNHYNPSNREPIEEVNRNSNESKMWRRSALQFSSGLFDKKGKKQGEWTWYFSNGSVMAEATFKDDVVSDSLIVYKFNEKITP